MTDVSGAVCMHSCVYFCVHAYVTDRLRLLLLPCEVVEDFGLAIVHAMPDEVMVVLTAVVVIVVVVLTAVVVIVVVVLTVVVAVTVAGEVTVAEVDMVVEVVDNGRIYI